MFNQKRICEEEIKVALRRAVTTAWEAGYAMGEKGEKKDCEPDVMENIIGDAWGKIRGALSDLWDAIIDAVNDKWAEVEKVLRDLFGPKTGW